MQKIFFCKQADEDAVVLIVTTAISTASNNKIVIIIGQDIDLLVILNQLNTTDLQIYLKKKGAGNVKDYYYPSNCYSYPSNQEHVAFLHCFIGCDTTSGFTGKGKVSSVKSLVSNQQLSNLASVFYEKMQINNY